MSSIGTTLLNSLRSVERPGDFCVGGIREIFTPTIDVDGVGRIAFPILPVQAERLIAIAEAAPYGRGDGDQSRSPENLAGRFRQGSDRRAPLGKDHPGRTRRRGRCQAAVGRSACAGGRETLPGAAPPPARSCSLPAWQAREQPGPARRPACMSSARPAGARSHGPRDRHRYLSIAERHCATS
jgi:hypothetical protein